MTNPAAALMTKTRDIFAILGFEEVRGLMTDQEPSYVIDLGNVRVEISQIMNMRFTAVLQMRGAYSSPNGRTLTSIDFGLPLAVESFEQGVALLVDGLGRDFVPEKPTTWFELGKKWKDRLPWASKPVLKDDGTA
jgi:hypothetical protein